MPMGPHSWEVVIERIETFTIEVLASSEEEARKAASDEYENADLKPDDVSNDIVSVNMIEV